MVCPGVNVTCREGNCYCLAGWEGDNCNEETRGKYIGSYQVIETCTTTAGGFPTSNRLTASITPTSRIDVITINNFTFTGGYIDVNIIDATTLYILEQRTGAIEVSGGQGIYLPFNDGIELKYNYKLSTTGYSCTATYAPF